MRVSARYALLPALGLVAFLADACTTQPVIQPSRDFDRPSDISFVCLGVSDGAAGADAGVVAGARVTAGLPMRECHPRGKIDPSNPDLRTFAFVPNSSSGDLTVLDADHWSLVNLDPANAGYNRLPLGVLPSQITSSDDGCRLVTANHGSCDLSVVDPAALLAPTLGKTLGTSVASASSTIVTNVAPITKNGHRPLHLAAGEIAFLPEGTSTDPAPQTACAAGDPGHQWRALATFPSCDLVALIDLPSGIIQQAAYAKQQDGKVVLVPVPDGEDPQCPVVDCLYSPPGPDASADPVVADGGGDASPVDAGAPAPSDGGAAAVLSTPEHGLRPGPIAIIPENGRAYVGLANAPFVIAFDILQDQLVVAAGGAIPLAEGALGVNRIRLSIDPYKEVTATTGKTVPGSFIGDDPAPDTSPEAKNAALDRRYLYVGARDGTLRVVQVAHQPETECDTNLDFSSITDETALEQAMTVACHPVVDGAVRRPGTTGPGIRLPTPPVDIAVNDVRPGSADQSETTVSGTHAWVLTANGAVYLVNIDPVPRYISWIDAPGGTNAKPLPCAAPPTDCHKELDPAPGTVRDRSFVGYSLSLDPSTGFPRLDNLLSQSSLGPRLESLWTVGSAVNATSLTTEYVKTQVYFPDSTTATPQTWAVTWQGNLSSARSSGQVASDGKSLLDFGADFCRMGAQPTDLVTLQGCTNSNQCGIGKACILGSNGSQGAGALPITGLCLDPALDRTTCTDLLSTVKRYDITTTVRNTLGIAPHKDEIVRPALSPCHPASGSPGDGGVAGSTPGDAGTGADGGAVKDDCIDENDPSTSLFRCVSLPGRRCLSPCKVVGETAGCRAGRICVSFNPATGEADGQTGSCASGNCYCADGPVLSAPATNTLKCLGELLPYQVSVGRGFLVSGSTAGVPATQFSDANGACKPIPKLDVRTAARISMDAPLCDVVKSPEDDALDSRCNPNLADPQCPTTITSSVTSTGGLPSPAQLDAQTTADKLSKILQARNAINPCLFPGGPNETDALNSSQPHVRALFRNREIEFMMTNLDQGLAGSYQARFEAHGGFQPQTVTIPSTVEVAMPTRIVLGPFDANPQTGPGMLTSEVPYLFVVDQRRLGRSQGGGPTRGQLLRIHPRGFLVTTPAPGAQPWFEDLAHSTDLFPIQ